MHGMKHISNSGLSAICVFLMSTIVVGDVVIDMPVPKAKKSLTIPQVFTPSQFPEKATPKPVTQDNPTASPGALAFARYSRGRYAPRNVYSPASSNAYAYNRYPYYSPYSPYGYGFGFRYGYGWPYFGTPFVFSHVGFSHGHSGLSHGHSGLSSGH